MDRAFKQKPNVLQSVITVCTVQLLFCLICFSVCSQFPVKNKVQQRKDSWWVADNVSVTGAQFDASAGSGLMFMANALPPVLLFPSKWGWKGPLCPALEWGTLLLTYPLGVPVNQASHFVLFLPTQSDLNNLLTKSNLRQHKDKDGNRLWTWDCTY